MSDSLLEAAVIARNPEDYDLDQIKAAARACLPHLRRDPFAQVCFGRLLHHIDQKQLHLQDPAVPPSPEAGPDGGWRDSAFLRWAHRVFSLSAPHLDRYLKLHPLDPDLVLGRKISLDRMGALEEADVRLHPALIEAGCQQASPRLLRQAAGAATARLGELTLDEAAAFARSVALGEIRLPGGATGERPDSVGRRATRDLRRLRGQTVPRLKRLAGGKALRGAWLAPLLSEAAGFHQELLELAGQAPVEDDGTERRQQARETGAAAAPWYEPICLAVGRLADNDQAGLSEIIYRLVRGESVYLFKEWLETLFKVCLQPAGVGRHAFEWWVEQLSSPAWEARTAVALPFCERAQLPDWHDWLRCLLTHEMPPDVRDWIDAARWRLVAADDKAVPAAPGEEDLAAQLRMLREMCRGLDQLEVLLCEGLVDPFMQRALYHELQELDLVTARALGPLTDP